jgi:hypothetical protein
MSRLNPVRACVDQNRRPAYLTHSGTARPTDVGCLTQIGRLKYGKQPASAP